MRAYQVKFKPEHSMYWLYEHVIYLRKSEAIEQLKSNGYVEVAVDYYESNTSCARVVDVEILSK